MAPKLLIEFIGTFFLVLVVGLSGNPVAVGAVLAAMVYMGGHVSGANYNPAVTLALWIKGALAGRLALAYAGIQMVAGILGAVAVSWIKGDIFILSPNVDYSFMVTLGVEVLFTFALASVVLHVASTKATSGNHYFGLAIGAVVAAGAFSVGPISGGAFNPAVGLGPVISDITSISHYGTQLMLYSIGPLLGGGLAGLVYKFTQTA